MTDRKIVDNVSAFIERAADLYTEFIGDRFREEMRRNCLECGLESPLEDLFWVAMHVLCTAESERLNPSPELLGGQDFFLPGVYMRTQSQIGTYRVDFVLSREPYIGSPPPPLVIELDGHAFHDKDKKQRAYEKSRDRYLVSQGYRVLHFTGSEIVADPFKVARECLQLLGVGSDDPYDPANPLDVLA